MAFRKFLHAHIAGSIFALMPALAVAQTPDASVDESSEAAIPEGESAVIGSSGEIVVTAARIRGSVETKVPPIDELIEADVQALGASSIADVVASLGAQSGSGRGRGSGPPVILLNGQRISSFRDLRDLPAEAIKKVEVFPEEVALQYGFRPDQRVMNFILKDNFASFSAEHEYGAPLQHSGFDRQEFETTFTRIGEEARFNVDLEFERRTKLTEDERNILSSSASSPFALAGNISGLGVGGEIDPALSALAGNTVTVAAVPESANPTLAAFAANGNVAADGETGQYRTLLPSFQRFQSTVSWSRSLGKQSNLSLNVAFEQQDQQSLLGLPSASFTLPASSPFSPFSSDVILNRYFDAPRPLSRTSTNRSLQFGAGYNGMIGDWRLALTGDYQISKDKSRTFTNADYTALRAAVSAGIANPFAAGFGNDLLFANPDTTESNSSPLSLRGTLSGRPFTLPAGPVLLTLRAGFDARNFDTVVHAPRDHQRSVAPPEQQQRRVQSGSALGRARNGVAGRARRFFGERQYGLYRCLRCRDADRIWCRIALVSGEDSILFGLANGRRKCANAQPAGQPANVNPQCFHIRFPARRKPLHRSAERRQSTFAL